jgi:hypothetical protein
MPGKEKKRYTAAQKQFFKNTLQRGYMPLTPKQVRFFAEAAGLTRSQFELAKQNAKIARKT